MGRKGGFLREKMERKSILRRIKELVNEYEQGVVINEETILAGTQSNLGLNSLDFISVILGVENAYKIAIPEEEIEKCKLEKVSNLIDYVLEKFEEKSP